MATSRRIVLHYHKRLVDRPIVSRLVRDYNLEFNILKAYVTPREEGLLVMELRGEERDYDRGVAYLTRTGVKVQPLSQDVTRNEDKCTHCGACVTICPVGAFTVDPSSRQILFSDDKCIACGLCINACPARAMEVRF